MIRLGIIGSRRLKDKKVFSHAARDAIRELGEKYEIRECKEFSVATCHRQLFIVTGDQKGVDTMVKEWAINRDMLYAVFHAFAAWRTMRADAFRLRTDAVVDYVDALIALPDPKSTGTIRGIKRARTRGIPVVVREVAIEKEE